MNPFNFRIGHRLALAFGVMLALVIAICFLGLTKMAAGNDDVRILAKERLPNLMAANQWIELTSRAGRHMRDVLILDDAGDIQKEIDGVYAAQKKRKTIYEFLEKAVVTPEGRAALKATESASKAYLGTENAFLQLRGEDCKAIPDHKRDFVFPEFV